MKVKVILLISSLAHAYGYFHIYFGKTRQINKAIEFYREKMNPGTYQLAKKSETLAPIEYIVSRNKHANEKM